MSVQKLHLNVFIGSPNDLSSEREFLKRTLEKLNDEFSRHHLELEAFDYHDVFSEPVHPQESINRRIASTDLVFLMFGYRLGKGALEEFRLAMKLYELGKLQNLMLYFKQMPPELLDDPGMKAKEVLDFKREIEGKILYHEFKDQEDFVSKLAKHLRLWLDSQRVLLGIVKEYADHLEESIIESMRVPDLPFTDEIIDLKASYTDLELIKMEEKAFATYLATPHPAHYQLGMKHFYLVARHLYRAIKRNDYSICRHKPFIYPIHQFLSKMVRSAHQIERENMGFVLMRWLAAREEVYETTRDFAAFELGMSKITEASDVLLQSLSDPYELFPVRNYAAMSLGMIGRREVVNKLIAIYGQERHQVIKKTIAHAILFIKDFSIGGQNRV